MQTGIIPGSLSAVTRDNRTTIAESFINADTIILVDTSGSMGIIDDHNAGIDRYTRACQELAKLQASLPGKIAVLAFSSTVVFCPSGTPTFLMAGTDLAGALKFIRVADDCDMRFIVISDGAPESERDALREAKRFTSVISTIFIGAEGDPGQSFLAKLAAASGGQASINHSGIDLASGIQKLLTAA